MRNLLSVAAIVAASLASSVGLVRGQAICREDPTTTESIPEDVIQQAKTDFEMNGGAVLTPSDAGYEEAVQPYDAKCTEHMMPYVVFVPATADDAASAVKIIKEYDEQFTILSGGHDYECQSSTKYAVIRTSLLNTIDIDKADKTITVGAGVLWGTVYETLQSEFPDYGVMGAQCELVSVSFATGGGYCWHMSRYHGIAAENAVRMEVVLADGELLTVDRENEQTKELMWALSGSGGMQLGFVTEFTYRLHKNHPEGYLFKTMRYTFSEEVTGYKPNSEGIYPLSMLKKVTSAWVRAVDKLKDDDDIGTMQVSLTRDGHSTNRTVLEMGARAYRLTINGPCTGCNWDRDKPSVSWTEKSFPPQSSETTHFETLNDYLLSRNWRYPAGTRNENSSYFMKGKIGNALAVSLDYFAPLNADENFDQLVAGRGLNLYMLKNIIKEKDRVSLNPRVSEATWHFTRRIRYSEEVEDGLFEAIKCDVRSWGDDLKWAMGRDYLGPYINYLDSTAEKLEYYGDNFERLQRAKAKYDAENFFKRMKGIWTEDTDSQCLKEICDGSKRKYYGY